MRTHSLWASDVDDASMRVVAAALPQFQELNELWCVAPQRVLASWSSRAQITPAPSSAPLAQHPRHSLGGVHLGDESARALATALPQCAVLQVVV